METCERLSRLFQLYIDGRLAPSEVRIIEAHLDACPTCRERLESLRRVDEICRSIPVTYPSDEERLLSWQAICGRLRLAEEAREERERLSPWRIPFQWLAARKPLLAISAAGCVILIAAVFFIMNRSDDALTRPGVILTYIEVASPDYVPILRKNPETDVPVLVLRRVTEEEETHT